MILGWNNLKFKKCISLSFLILFCGPIAAKDFLIFQDLEVPAAGNAFEPSIYVTKKDQLLMSWMEERNGSTIVNSATLNDGRWSKHNPVAVSSNIFVNWADFPSIVALDDGTLVVHWLEKSGNSAYTYDIKISLSDDKGASWSPPLKPHFDRTESQHGFVSILPIENHFMLFWLDGRAYEDALLEEGAAAGAMQLRAAVLLKNGIVEADFSLDLMTCSCCQTSAVLTSETVIVVYRDRTADETRDVSIKRLRNGVWSKSETVHQDGWKIYGCPVNGPAIDAFGNSVFVGWFTAANDKPEVKVAISKDAGLKFSAVFKIPSTRPIGHVDIEMIDEQTGIVSWLEWADNKETLKICKITFNGCSQAQIVYVNTSNRSLNFPKISSTSSTFYITWTQPLSDGRRTIKMLSAPLGK